MSTPRTLTLAPGVARHDVTTSRGTFAALEARPAGPEHAAVLLVPGWTGSKEDFADLLVELAGAGYRALTVDQRGQYETAGGPDPAAYGLPELARDALSVARTLPTRPHLLGHSFGGLVVRAAALLDPAAIRSVTLLCSGPGALPAAGHELLRRLAASIDTLGLAATWQAKRAHDLAAAGVAAPPPEIEDFLRRRFLANSAVGLREKTLHLVREPDRCAELAATGLPLHVCYGTLDDSWPAAVQADMADRLGASRTVLDGLGHSPAVEDPTATAAALLAFWTPLDALAG